VDPATSKGKCDFQFRWLLNEVPSCDLRDFMKRDLIVELKESRPKIVEKKNEDGTMTKET